MKRGIGVISILALSLAGCGLFDSGVVWKGGPYILGWIDLPDEVTVSYDLGKGAFAGRIEAQVLAIGWDGRYLVAKQHPAGNKSVTNYFIIDARKDSPVASIHNVVIGPLTAAEFRAKSVELSLPEFTRELTSLR